MVHINLLCTGFMKLPGIAAEMNRAEYQRWQAVLVCQGPGLYRLLIKGLLAHMRCYKYETPGSRVHYTCDVLVSMLCQVLSSPLMVQAATRVAANKCGIFRRLLNSSAQVKTYSACLSLPRRHCFEDAASCWEAGDLATGDCCQLTILLIHAGRADIPKVNDMC